MTPLPGLIAPIVGATLSTLGIVLLPDAILPPDDALRGTWLVTPTVVAMLYWIARRIGDQRRWTAWGLAGVALTAPARHGLDLPAADALWIGALFALLGGHVVGMLPELRRHLGRPTPDRRRWPDAVFWLLPFAVYLAIQPWAVDQRPTDGDEPYYLLLAHSLADDGDLDLADEYRDGVARSFVNRDLGRQPGDPTGEQGEIYSRHNALLPVILAPAYAIAGRSGAALMMACFSAGLAWTVLSLAHRLWPERPGGAFATWVGLAFTPPLLIYAHQIWIEVPAAWLVALALSRLLDLQQEPDKRSAAWLGLWLTLLVLLKLRLLLIAAPIAVLAASALMRRPSSRRLAGGLIAMLGVGLAAILAGNFARYGNPFKIYSRHEAGLLTSPPIDWLRGGLGIFFDGAFGLFALAPLWLLLLPAAWMLLRNRDAFLATLAVVAGPYLLALAPRLEWYGGWSPPFRYPMAVLPLLALTLVPLVDRRSAGTRVLIAGLGALTAGLSLLWLVLPGWTYNLADGGSHLLHQAGSQIGADIGRFVPSMVRWRLATWWGPVLALAVIPIALWHGRAGHRARARRVATPLGLGLLLVGAAALPVLGHAVPTRVVEPEDAWVVKSGGAADPSRWTPQRPLYRGSWWLPAGHTTRIPVVAGGDRVTLRIMARRQGPSMRRLVVMAGAETVETVELPGAPAEAWVEVEIGPIPWPDGAELVLRAPPTPRRPEGGAVVDRIDLEWHGSPIAAAGSRPGP